MLGSVVNLEIPQGADFRYELTVCDSTTLIAIDVSTYTYAADIRATPGASSTLATFVVDMTQAASGIVGFTLTDLVTATLPTTGGVWDIRETTAGGSIWRPVYGAVFVQEDVTRS